MGALGNLDHERFCQAAHKRLWAGEKRSEALATAYRDTMYRGANPDDAALKPNARRLANRKDVGGRLKELAEYAGTLSALDSGWALRQLKGIVDKASGFTLDPYFRRDADGTRINAFDLSNTSEEQIALLTEVTTETIVTRDEDGTETVRHKIKLRGPDKFSVVPATIDKMAAIAGWKAPTKIAPTTPDGQEPLSLLDLVNAAAAKRTERAA